MSIDALILAVSSSSSAVELADAYIAARRPCLDADRMADLIDAHDAAERRIEPVAFTPSPSVLALFR